MGATEGAGQAAEAPDPTGGPQGRLRALLRAVPFLPGGRAPHGPTTRRTVLARRVKNQRLAAVGYQWAFSALTSSSGARAHYDRRRALGDHHAAVQRNLYNRLLGCLHHCLKTDTAYDEQTAFTTPQQAAA